MVLAEALQCTYIMVHINWKLLLYITYLTRCACHFWRVIQFDFLSLKHFKLTHAKVNLLQSVTLFTIPCPLRTKLWGVNTINSPASFPHGWPRRMWYQKTQVTQTKTQIFQEKTRVESQDLNVYVKYHHVRIRHRSTCTNLI